MKYPESLEKLIKCFELYPGIGAKTAERMALHTVSNMTSENVNHFSHSLKEVIKNIKKCKECGNLTDQEICEICLDDSRKESIMIVENPKDIIAFEKAGIFDGKYHVLNGCISPMNGIGPDDINLNTLIQRIDKENIGEIIISLSSTIPGEMTALYIKKMVENLGVSVYRIGYGLPVGANIEYADEITLKKALEGMTKI